MEAASRELSSEKAQRIVDAMRGSVARRGVAGSTFDHVAREAGVSRGLLHYYFGTKERLLVEVLRRDCDIRMALLDAAFAPARSRDELVDAMVGQLEDLVRNDPSFMTLLFELFTLSRNNPELEPEMADLTRRVRERLADLLTVKRQEGVIELAAAPDAVSTVLFSLADGLALRMLCEPDRDYGPAIEAGVAAVRALVLEPAV